MEIKIYHIADTIIIKENTKKIYTKTLKKKKFNRNSDPFLEIKYVKYQQ